MKQLALTMCAVEDEEYVREFDANNSDIQDTRFNSVGLRTCGALLTSRLMAFENNATVRISDGAHRA